MKKFLVSVALSLCLVGAANPMKRQREITHGEEGESPAQQQRHDDFVFDLSECPDILCALAEFIGDYPTFSAIVRVSKGHYVCLSNRTNFFPVTFSLVDAVNHGSANATRLCLANVSGMNVEAPFSSCKKEVVLSNGQTSKAIENKFGSCETSRCMYSFSFAGQSTDPNMMLDNACCLLFGVKGEGSRTAILWFSCQEAFGQQLNNYCSLDCFSTETQEAIVGTSHIKIFPAACPHAQSPDDVFQYVRSKKPNDSLMLLSKNTDDQVKLDLVLINTEKKQNRQQFRWQYFCLNVLFIIAAQKSDVPVMSEFLANQAVCKLLPSETLSIAADMTTDDTVKQLIINVLNGRKS